ncbi:hypothetical protein [Cohnella thailandensis]|uniref:Uncharacterized protein n=1 Tax=Cohnella thailandensis TaxID=557557 RepID=A0A841SMA2_9BACL|nr:hypothetical protein [Cohnella thailandensis]MBB6633603.1 hypothetical protein [Cohnella thailandensis]MBP1974622.1 hypothetical protein [Cohnella thailandensis]
MIVRWLRPGLPPSDWDCPDIEQLLFLLRLVPAIHLNGHYYRFVRATLMVEPEAMSVAIQVANDAAPDFESGRQSE